MANIKLGRTGISGLKLGNHNVGKIFRGQTQIRPASPSTRIFNFSSPYFEKIYLYQSGRTIESITIDFNSPHTSNSRASSIVALSTSENPNINSDAYAAPFVRQGAQYTYSGYNPRYGRIGVAAEPNITYGTTLQNLGSGQQTNAAGIVTLTRTGAEAHIGVNYGNWTRETSWDYTSSESDFINGLFDDPNLYAYTEMWDAQNGRWANVEVTYS